MYQNIDKLYYIYKNKNNIKDIDERYLTKEGDMMMYCCRYIIFINPICIINKQSHTTEKSLSAYV